MLWSVVSRDRETLIQNEIDRNTFTEEHFDIKWLQDLLREKEKKRKENEMKLIIFCLMSVREDWMLIK